MHPARQGRPGPARSRNGHCHAAALISVGISAALRAAGVSGAVLNRLDGAAATIQSGLDTLQSVQDCTVSWATGGAGPPLSIPSYQGGQGAAVGQSVAEGALEAKGYTRALDGLGAASSAFDTVNIFAGGLGNYFAEPSESWAAIVGIGGCVRDSAIATANSATRAVR